MAITVSMAEVWSAEMLDQPGALDRILTALAAAGVNLDCIIARRSPDKPGFGHVYLTPVKGRKGQDAARSVGMQLAAGMATLRVETPNKSGQGHAVLQAVADAGVNVRGVSGVSIGSKSVAYIGFDSVDDAARALKAIKAAGKKR